MKHLLSLFLFLLPCFALAQYPSNGNQKITLGEQTTADGLIFRGVLADTGIITPRSDTSAYIILDTVNHRFYNYNRSTNVWSVTTIGSISSGLTGVLPVANGGTGQSTLANAGIVTASGTTNYLSKFSGTTTLSNSNIFESSAGQIGYGTASPVNVNNYKFITANASLGSGFIAQVNGVSSLYFYSNVNGSLFSEQRNLPLIFEINGSPKMYLNATGLGINLSTQSARLHIEAGTATASTAPLKLNSGTLMTAAEIGAIENNGTNLFFTPSTTRHTVNHGLTGSATLNFPSTNAQLSADLTITVTGAADGDVVSLGVPNAAVNANTSYSAWVSAANTVTVRFNNYSSGTVDPASALFKVFVTK